MTTRIELEQAVGLMTEGQSSLGAEPCRLDQALGRTLCLSGNSDCPVCGRDTLLALVTDLPINLPGVPRIAFGDGSRAAVILQYRNRGEDGHV